MEHDLQKGINFSKEDAKHYKLLNTNNAGRRQFLP